jgi:hypothetical protein
MASRNSRETSAATRGPVARAAPEVVSYILGADRNNPDEARAHLYAKTTDGDLWPMCDYGWNRSDGERFSILRGNGSARGTCKICTRRMHLNLAPVTEPRTHRTRWL